MLYRIRRVGKEPESLGQKGVRARPWSPGCLVESPGGAFFQVGEAEKKRRCISPARLVALGGCNLCLYPRVCDQECQRAELAGV